MSRSHEIKIYATTIKRRLSIAQATDELNLNGNICMTEGIKPEATEMNAPDPSPAQRRWRYDSEMRLQLTLKSVGAEKLRC